MDNEQNSQVRPIFMKKTPDEEFSGEEPIILPDEQGEHEGFSAWTYSDHFVSVICKTLKKDIWKHKHFIRKQ